MSKRTTGVSRWSGWQWGRTRAARESRGTARRTAKATAARLGAACAVLLLLWTGGFTRRPEQLEYDETVKTYLRGELAAAAERAHAASAKADPRSEWHWKNRLLEAEALTALSRTKDAEKLLADPAPAG